MVDALNNTIYRPEAISVKETEPKTIVDFQTPQIRVANTDIRLALHTDTAINLVRVLREQPIRDLYFKVRLPTDEEWEKIKSTPRYRIHMEGRYRRAETQHGIDLYFVRPRDIVPDQTQLSELLHAPHRPETISELDGVDYK